MAGYDIINFVIIRRRIEVVITGLTRNQLYLTVPWVRIPPLPPVTQNRPCYTRAILGYAKGFKLRRFAACSQLFSSIVFARFALMAIRFRASREIPQKQRSVDASPIGSFVSNLFGNDSSILFLRCIKQV